MTVLLSKDLSFFLKSIVYSITMGELKKKIIRNFKDGTVFTKGIPTVKKRIIKAIYNSHTLYFLNRHRRRTKAYLSSIPTIDSNHYQAGNYYLDKRNSLDQNSIIYSLGILDDIRFDQFISDKIGCNIFMFDPTPSSIEFMSAQKNENFIFFPLGVWTEESTLKFFEPKLGGSSSVIESNNYKTGDYFKAKCNTVKYFMALNKHTNIDVFKADIEGAALPILAQMIEQKIFPSQIVVEFERPKQNQDEID